MELNNIIQVLKSQIENIKLQIDNIELQNNNRIGSMMGFSTGDDPIGAQLLNLSIQMFNIGIQAFNTGKKNVIFQN